MSDDTSTPAGSDDDTTGQPDPAASGNDFPPDPFGYSDDFGAVKEYWELYPEDEARRAELEAAARRYGEAGWRVIPLYPVDDKGACTCRKGPECDSAGKHPRMEGWRDKATTQPDWWRQGYSGMPLADWFPRANIGVALDADTTFVLDEDPDNGGDITLEQILERLGEETGIPPTIDPGG